MRAISVADLAAADLRQYFDHQSYGASLNGEFEYCDYTAYPTIDYECLMLIDPDTFTGIKCRTTAFDRSLIGMSVTVRVWYLRWFNDALLDVCLTEAVIQDTQEPVLQLIEKARSLRAQNLIHSCTSSFLTLPYVQLNSRSFNLLSTVLAKSPVFLDQDQKPYFMLQVVENDMTAFIVFRGKNMRMYYCEIEVDQQYVFTSLEQAIQSAASQQVLLFNDDKSDFCKVHEEQAATVRQQLPTDDPLPDALAPSIQPWKSARYLSNMGNYTGIVTALIDQVLGLYLLDNNCLLVLTQYPAYYPLTSLWQGSKITVKRVHISTIHSNEFSSAFLERFCQSESIPHQQTATWLSLVGCTHTSIVIESLPVTPSVKLIKTGFSIVAAFMANNIFVHKHGYFRMLTWLEAYWSLHRKIRDANENRSALIAATNVLLEKSGYVSADDVPRNLVQEFLDHNTECTGCSHPSDINDQQQPTSFNLQNYPDLSKMKARLTDIPNLKEVTIASTIHNANPLTNIAIQAYNYSLDNTKPLSCVLVGFICGGVDGRLYFADSTGRIPMVAMGDQNFPKDTLYIIKECTIIEEDLSYTDDDGGRVDSICQYLLVKVDNIINLQPTKPKITFCTSIPKSIEKNRLFAYDPSPVLSAFGLCNSYVIRVEKIQVPNLAVDSFGKHYLACYIQVVLFDLVPLNAVELHTLSASPTVHTLSLSSASQTLALLPSITQGGWYVLQNGNGEINPLPHTIALDGSAAVYPILPKDGRFKLRQFAMGLRMLQESASVAPNSVPSVNDVLNINFAAESEPESPAILSNGFYKKLVSFEGYVVLKEFTESRLRSSEMDKYIQPFYSHLGVGTGKPNRWLYMRIRAFDTQDTIDVYYDVSRTWYPHGIFPGTKVVIHDALLKVSEKNKTIYGVIGPGTRIQVLEAVAGQKMQGDHDQEVENRPLVWFLRDADSNKVYKTTCTVKSLQQVSVGWICLECGQKIINSICYGQCTKDRKLFLADAVVTVSDGTADITVSVDGEDFVMSLLKLSPGEVVKLKEATLLHGEMTYSNWFGTAIDDNADNNANGPESLKPGRTLHTICTNPKVFDLVTLYVKRITRKANNSNKNDDTPKQQLFDKLQVLPIKLSSSSDDSDTVQSLTFNRVRLKAIRIETVDVVSQAAALL